MPIATTRLLASIEHPVRDRSRENLKREQPARREAEDGHEPCALTRSTAIGWHVVGRTHQCGPRDRGGADDHREAGRSDERQHGVVAGVALIHISEPTRLLSISYVVF